MKPYKKNGHSIGILINYTKNLVKPLISTLILVREVAVEVQQSCITEKRLA